MDKHQLQMFTSHVENLILQQYDRIEKMKQDKDFIDYSKLDKITIGIAGGDGIGPEITSHAQNVLQNLLKEEENKGKISFKNINGLTLENRIKANKAIPDDVLEELKQCHIILKGPTTTPRAGDSINIESANVAMRKELDLFANVRPICIPNEGIDWVFYRENTEGAYALGNKGYNIDDELCIDFTVTTKEGSERIIRAAFDYAKKSGKNKVSVITKANVIKTTDGKFLEIAGQVAKDYPEVEWDDWYIDILAAKLVDKKRRTQFKVVVLPNLYGDIITDEAAEFQGGVGTAGSANIGKKYAMFEAIHGSAPRMVAEGRSRYADPCSMLRAVVMLLEHIGYNKKANMLRQALDICMIYEKKLIITGRQDGAAASEFVNYLLDTLNDINLNDRYLSYISK